MLTGNVHEKPVMRGIKNSYPAIYGAENSVLCEGRLCGTL